MSATINNPMRPVAPPCHSPVNTNEDCGFNLQTNDDLTLRLREQEKTQQVEATNRYWSKFSNSNKSMPTYLNSLYTNSQSSCLANNLRKESFPKETIERRLLNMRPVGSLNKQDMYYLLSFTLNLNHLNPLRRRDFMELLQQRNLLNNEILNYLQIIVRRPSAGLNQEDIETFLILCEEIKAHTPSRHATPNPYALITRSDAEFDAKQLIYLKNILKTKRYLSQNQLQYLLNLLEGLHDMSETRRNQFFKTLCKNQVPAVTSIQLLGEFLLKHSRPFDSKKLRILLYELEDLMGIETQSPRIIKENMSKASKRLGEIDLADVRKSLDYLMKGGIPNIVRLNNFKQFLTNLLSLNPEQLEQNIKQLKNSNTLSLEDFKFIQNFVAKENLQGDVEKKKLLCQLLKVVLSTNMDKTPSAVFSIAPAKGPTPMTFPRKEEELQRNLQALTPCGLYEARLVLEMDEKSKDKELDFKKQINATDTEKTSTTLAPTSSKTVENVVPSMQKGATASETDTGKQTKSTEKSIAVDAKKQKSVKDKTDALEEKDNKAEAKSKKNVMDKIKPEKGKFTKREEKESAIADLSNIENKTDESKNKKTKTKDKLSTENTDEAQMESADINKGEKTTSKEGKTKGHPVETIFTKTEDKSATRKAKVTKHKEINFEVVTSELDVAEHDEDVLKTPIKSSESLSKTKATPEIKTSSDLIGKKKMPNIMESQQSKPAAGASFFKTRSFFGKTNKIVSIRNGELILR